MTTEPPKQSSRAQSTSEPDHMIEPERDLARLLGVILAEEWIKLQKDESHSEYPTAPIDKSQLSA